MERGRRCRSAGASTASGPHLLEVQVGGELLGKEVQECVRGDHHGHEAERVGVGQHRRGEIATENCERFRGWLECISGFAFCRGAGSVDSVQCAEL